MASFAVILPAAGASSRFKDKYYKKPFASLNGRPVWLHSAEVFLNRDDVKQLIVAVSPEDEEFFNEKYAANVAILGIEVVRGGRERADSVAAALAKVRDDVDFIAVHDAARPCIVTEWVDQVFEAARKTGAAIFAVPVAGTLKRATADGRSIAETVSRENLYEAQTPQVFRRQVLIDAYAGRGDSPATDDAQLVEQSGHPVAIVPGSPINMKITTKEDLRLAAQAIKALPKPKVFGTGNPFAGDDVWR